METESRCDPVETHEKFLQRVSKFFPVDSSLAWSRLERAVFNNLMSKLIFRYGYAEISDAMLQTTREQMQTILRRSPRSETAWYIPEKSCHPLGGQPARI